MALEQIHEQMREIERRRRRNAEKIREVSSKARLIRSKLVKSIALETDSNGKRVFSNRELRRAELEIRLSENEEYQNLMEEHRRLHEKDKELAFEWNLLVDKKALLLGA